MIRSDKYPRHGLARALSKLNFCSRRKAVELIRSGAVLVNGIARLDPEWPVHVGQEHIEVSGRKVEKLSDVYVMINKPRGIATQSTDPQGRLVLLETLSELPSLVVVGSLDKTSEGLLLLSNDTVWGRASRIRTQSWKKLITPKLLEKPTLRCFRKFSPARANSGAFGMPHCCVRRRVTRG